METIKVWQVTFTGDTVQELSPPFATREEADAHGEYLVSIGFDDPVVDCTEIPIDHALEEQDKRTRHAIADAVAQHLLELGMEPPGIDAVIMNCRGGLTDG